jgi:hypothetical protein
MSMGVVNQDLLIGGCFFIVNIQFHSHYRAIFPVGAGTVSAERIRVLIRFEFRAASSKLSMFIADKLI